MQTTVTPGAPPAPHPPVDRTLPLPCDRPPTTVVTLPPRRAVTQADRASWFEEARAEALRDGGRLIPTAAQAFADELGRFRAAYPLIAAHLGRLLPDPGPAPLPDGHLLDPGEVAVDRALVGGYERYAGAIARGNYGIFNDHPSVAAANAAAIARGEGLVLARYPEPWGADANGPWVDVAVMLSPGGNRTVVARAEGHHELAPPA
jgi:hypothetical protein